MPRDVVQLQIPTFDPRSMLAAMRGVQVIDRPAPRAPEVVAMILAGIRCIEVRENDNGTFRTVWYHRLDAGWVTLADGVCEDDAWASALMFSQKVQPIPADYSPANDLGEITVAKFVAAVFDTMRMEIAA